MLMCKTFKHFSTLFTRRFLPLLFIAAMQCHLIHAQVPTDENGVVSGHTGRDINKILRFGVGGGPALPNHPIDADINIKSAKTSKWNTGSKVNMLCENRVTISIGAYAFDAEQAVIFITPKQFIGKNAHQVEVYFKNVDTDSGPSAIKQRASRLLVTAIVVGKVSLTTDSYHKTDASANPLVIAAKTRVERYHAAIAQRIVQPENLQPLYSKEILNQRNKYNKTTDESDRTVDPDILKKIDASVKAKATGNLPVDTDKSQLPSKSALLDFSADSTVVQGGKDEDYVVLNGNLQVAYTDAENNRRVILTADKALIFLTPGALKSGLSQSKAAEVKGIYLEDNVVVTDGQYTIRGPRVYYDIQHNQAIILEAVFYTWDPSHKIPIYVRARELRQQSDTQWIGKDAKLTTSEFHEPHFAIGLSQVTVTRKNVKSPEETVHFKTEGANFQFGGREIFYWPGTLQGDAADIPLRKIDVGYSKRKSGFVETEWDLFSVFGLQPVQNIQGDFKFDTYTNRGVGTGVNLTYDTPKAFGEFEGYFLFDQAQDEPGGRMNIDPETEYRGKFRLQHRHYLQDDWQLTLQATWLSDPTFLEEFYRSEANAEQEFEHSLYLHKQIENKSFSFYVRDDIIDFIPQSTVLQTAGNAIGVGTTTQKLPEIDYHQIATPFWGNRLTWYSENRVSAMKLNFSNVTPADLGYNPAESLALFGIANTTSFDSSLRAIGLDQETRHRLDTRQEIQAPLKWEGIDIVPFAAIRLTMYDTGFSRFAGEDRNERLWGSIGLRLHTQYSNTYNNIDFDALDIHRIHHIIEPHATIMHAGTNIEQEKLPVYDYDVESLASGFITRIGVRNTFQTQRGGPGRWRNVDFVRLDTDFIMADGTARRESPIARFVDYRPEFSLFGDHFYSELAWQVTDSLSYVTNINHSFEAQQIARWNTGINLRHSPRLNSFIQIRAVQAAQYKVIRYGIDYMLTPKYHVEISQSIDLKRSQSRDISFILNRRLPRWLLTTAFTYDTIDNDWSIGIALSPEGFGGSGSVSRNPFALND